MNSCHTKRLVVELLERYVNTTDNDIDNVIAATVKTALLEIVSDYLSSNKLGNNCCPWFVADRI